MMININVPKYSLYEQTYQKGNPVSIYNGLPHQAGLNQPTRNYTMMKDQFSKVDVLRRVYDDQFTGKNFSYGITGKLSNNLDIAGITMTARRTRRIKESILLYMPSTAAYKQSNIYEDISLTNIMREVGVGAFQGIANALGAGGAAIAGSIGAAAGVVGNAANLAGKLNNNPINPRIEVIYSSPTLRTFDFAFIFAPSNERESIAIDNIIRTLRFHAAPELSNMNFTIGSFQNPFFMTPPAEFDITFFHKGKENTRIPRISTCVLESIDVDYAQTGIYSTFDNGYPVATLLTLRFKEIEVQTKLRILTGH